MRIKLLCLPLLWLILALTLRPPLIGDFYSIYWRRMEAFLFGSLDILSFTFWFGASNSSSSSWIFGESKYLSNSSICGDRNSSFSSLILYYITGPSSQLQSLLFSSSWIEAIVLSINILILFALSLIKGLSTSVTSLLPSKICISLNLDYLS